MSTQEIIGRLVDRMKDFVLMPAEHWKSGFSGFQLSLGWSAAWFRLTRVPLSCDGEFIRLEVPVKERLKAATLGTVLGVFSGASQHMGFAAFEPLRRTLIFFPLPSPSHKGPILACRPLTLKWASLDLLRVLARGIYETLFLTVHRPHFLTHPPSLSLAVYFLCNPTRAFNHEITISFYLPSTLGGSRELRRDVDGAGPISKG
jgi:hypothetical protein